MSFLNEQIISVLVGKNLSRTASVQVTDSTNSTTFIASGEIVALDKTGVALTAGKTVADSDNIVIAQGDGASNPVVFSHRIYGNTVTGFSGISYTPAQEQISYIGYNGSSGSIDAINNNLYQVRVAFKQNKLIFGENQSNSIYQEFTSDSSATQLEIAQGLVLKLSAAYPAQQTDIKVERVTDGTFTVLGGSSTLAVTNGSTTATASSASHGLVAGSVVRIGGTSSTTPVYVVSSVNSTAIVLDQAYQGTSGTVANANVGAMSAITSWGIKFTGKSQTFTVGQLPYTKVSFDLTVGNFGATTVTDSQAVSRGNGTYEEVAQLEYFALGYEGWTDIRNAVPAKPQPRTNATSGSNYDIITIQGLDVSDFGYVSGIKPSKFTVYICIVDGANQTTSLLAQLNPWMASTPRAFNAVTV